MISTRLSRLTRVSALLAAGLLVPSARGAWGSLHANNRSSTIPERPAFRSERGRSFEHTAPVIRAPENRREEHVRNFEPQRGREFERAPERRDWGRYHEWESERRRGDFDDDRRDSFYWSRFHRGEIINVLPPDYFQFSIGGAPYYYYGGVYYEGQPAGGYVVVPPPLGAVVPDLPPGAESVAAGNNILYYANGTFYALQPNGYQVVPAPIGVTVSLLPPDAAAVIINGRTCYESNGVYYMPVMQNGVTAYVTIPPP